MAKREVFCVPDKPDNEMSHGVLDEALAPTVEGRRRDAI